MDALDRQHLAAAYLALAEVLGRERPQNRPENHLSYALGDLAGRIFVGANHLPPEELLERVAAALRAGEQEEQHKLAEHLREHARMLEGEAKG
jgi:aspartate oxidase